MQTHDNATLGARISALVVSALLSIGAVACEEARDDARAVNIARDAGTSPDALGSCRDLKNCRLRCLGDPICERRCDEQTAPAAKVAYDTVMACVNANACTDDPCVEEKCGALLDVCFERKRDGGAG